MMPPIYESTKEIQVHGSRLRYHESGQGSPAVFVHGLLANATLWRDVVARLSGSLRCVAPDLPLGGHPYPMQVGADLSPPGVAKVVVGLLEALDLRDVTLVGNDTGGAICQIVVAQRRERIGRLVLTNCDAYEAFLPTILSPFHYGARFFGEHFVNLMARALRSRSAQRLLLKSVAKRRLDAKTLDAYFAPILSNAGVRRDLTRFLTQISNRYTLEAAESFPSFQAPVLIAWGQDDLFFSSRLARRLQQDFPNATLESVPGSRAFVPEDRPERLAALIEDFSRPRHPSPQK